MLPVVFSFMFFLVTCCNSLAQKNVKSNLEIFDDEISKQLELILYKPDLRRDIQFIFSVNSKSSSEEQIRFLNSVIKKTAERSKIWVSLTRGNIASVDSVYNSIYLEIIELKTRYPGFAKNHFLGSKVVRRNLISLISVAVNGNNYGYSYSDTISVNYNDRVELDNIENLETEDYKFTKAEQPRISLYEEIVFPVAVVVVSVAAAIMFFSIRSK